MIINVIFLTLCSSKYFRARYNANKVGIDVVSFTNLPEAPVAPGLPSIVIKSGFEKTAISKSSSILPAAILIPIGLPFG